MKNLQSLECGNRENTKRSALFRFLLVSVCFHIPLFGLSGCVNAPPLPKDALIRGATTEISTPWGSAKQVITEAATGTAAVKAAGLK